MLSNCNSLILDVHGRGSNPGKSTGLVEATVERQIYVSEVETTDF